MSKFWVYKREVWIAPVEIEAESEEEALEKALDGDGDEVETNVYPEYSHTLNPETWTVGSPPE